MVRKAKDEMKARTSLPITMSSQYVRDWTGAWPPIRELIQNGLDGHRKGYSLSIDFTFNVEGEGVLHIINEGITMDRDALVLGNSSKIHDPEMAGKFGEGMKLAWMVGMRQGLRIWTKVGNERWIPRMAYSPDYKSEIMFVDIAPCKYENKIHVKVEGLSKSDWEAIKKRVLHLSPPELKETNYAGSILLDTAHKGKLFVKGLYVGDLKDALYGYDLINLELDRDRRVPSRYNLEYEVANVLRDLLRSEKIHTKQIFDILSTPSTEASALQSYCSSDISRNLSEYFEKLYNDPNMILVSSISEEEEAKHYGFRPIIVPSSVKEIYEKSNQTFLERIKSIKKTVKKTYGASELTEKELEIWNTCVKLVEPFLSPDTTLSIVDYHSDNIQGMFSHDKDLRIEISVCKRNLSSYEETLKTLVHEVAHCYGGDASHSHLERMCEIFAKIVFNPKIQ